MQKNNLDTKAIVLIKDKLNFGILNTVYEICMHSQEKTTEDYNIPKHIEEYKKDILLNFKNIDCVLNKGIEERREEIRALEKTINNLEKDAMPFLACLNFCDLLSAVISDYYQLKTVILDSDGKLPMENTIKEVYSLIDFSEKNGTLFQDAGILLSVIPYSMTKENYSDYIYKSFQYLFEGADKGMVLNSIKTLKFKFSSFNQINDKNIKIRLEEIIKLNFEEKDKDELLSILEEIDCITKEYAQIIGDISAIYGSLMEILAIFKFCIDKEYLFDEDFILRDIFYSTKEMIEKNNFEIMYETIINNCEEKIEQIIEKIDKEENELKKAVKNMPYEKLPNTIKIVIALDEYSGVNFEKNVIFKSDYIENNEKVDEEFIKEMANDFVDYINKLDFSNKLLKRFKQQFFYYIPCPFSRSFLKEHFKGVLFNLSDKVGILTSYKLLSFKNAEILNERENNQHTNCGHNHHDGCCEHHH